MTRTINRVELLGRVGTDPEMKYTPGGTAVTRLRLATDRYRKNVEDATDWHTVVVWGKQGEAVNTYVGRVSGSTWRAGWCRTPGMGDDGKRRHSTEVHASEVVFLDSTNGAGDSGNAGPVTSASPF